MAKPKVGIFGLTSCAGDQLVVVNLEDELLDVVGAIDLRSFIMAASNPVEDEFDVALVEGSVVTAEDEERLREIRAKSKLLVAIGTCAVWGGIPGALNDLGRNALYRIVYGTDEDLFKASVARPLKAVVPVDFTLPGCPIEKHQLLEALASLLHGDLPIAHSAPVCLDCRFNENLCLLKAKGQLCLGPVTAGGCRARCPSHGLPCEGCHGPVEEANFASEVAILQEKGFSRERIARAIRNFAHQADLARTR
ncbi:MAG: NADH-quinone oxidoreductase subunit B family protein [Bacillota bacterium]